MRQQFDWDDHRAEGSQLAHWIPFLHVRRPLDLVGPRSDGAIVLAAAGRLSLLRPTGEGGALTDAIRCSAAACRVRFVADGPAGAHVEGHVAFASSG